MRTCEFCKSIISDDLKVCDNCISKVNGLREILGKNKEESLLEDQEIKEKTRIDKEESKKFKRELSMLAFIIFVLVICIFLVSSQRKYYMEENMMYENIQDNLNNREYDEALYKIDNLLKNTLNTNYKKELTQIKNEIKYDKEFASKGFGNLNSHNDYKEFNSIYYNGNDDLNLNSQQNDLVGNGLYYNFNSLYGQVSNIENDDQILSNYSNNILNKDLNSQIDFKGEVRDREDYIDVTDEEKEKFIKISKYIVNLSHEFSIVTRFPSIKTNMKDWIIQRNGDMIRIRSYLTYISEYSSIIKDTFEIILREDTGGYKLIDLFINENRIKNLVY